ncbi:MAG TPA: asparagine--tRNA ligase, partial [Cytophagales bacterium]|nr:asparagine--tRNA ligase [Cytophagales bacterium]
MKRTKIKDLLSGQQEGQSVLAQGWVRTVRSSKNVSFIALNDGSTLNNLQVVADAEQFSEEDLAKVATGACISVEGELIASQGSGQKVELKATTLEVLGE